ncbi:DUF58 domain-containing protein [Agromyces sp. SYSU T00194]|uniref:DUF58 domain-containing protein n=1 Tax=Agromyces chitinivorans TaxID=3158560 RepID=UPI003398E10A
MTGGSGARLADWPRPTRRGAVLIAAGVIVFLNALVLDRRDFILFGLIGIAVPAVALAFVAWRVPRLDVTRSFVPGVVAAGGTTTASATVRNRGRRTLDGARWRDQAAHLETPAESVLPPLGRWEGGPAGGGDTVRLEYTLRLPRRGVFAAGPLRVSLSDPFGLARIERGYGRSHDLVATPRVTSLGASAGGPASLDGVLLELQRQSHPNADELIAREYRHGDPLRRVNWPATARHGEIMVRQEEQRSDPDARIIVDTALHGRGRTSFAVGEDRYHHPFELGVEIAASVGVHLLRGGFRVTVSETGPSQLEPGPRRRAGGLFGDAPVEYQGGTGERALLEGLAHLASPGTRTATGDRSGAPHDDPRRVGGRARRPAFAVLVDIAPDEAAALAVMRPAFEPAVAFVLETVRGTLVGDLEDAGWRCIPVRSAQDIPTAWHAVAPEQGAGDAA